ICFIDRGETNKITKESGSKTIYNIFSQTTRKLSPKTMEKFFDVLEQIFQKVPIYHLECNMSDEAVLTSYNAMKPVCENK
ncbi:MAG: hypothetical protein LUG21_05360, partial [Clostridiales bacterium]|nr:hypothetical protein [Clostridiales bacterium]